MFEERNTTKYYCKKCKKRISKSHKAKHFKEYHLESNSVLTPTSTQLNWFSLYIHRLSRIKGNSYKIIAPKEVISKEIVYSNFKQLTVLKQEMKEISHNVFSTSQSPVTKKMTIESSAKQQENLLFYCKWFGESVINEKIMLFKKTFRKNHRNSPTFWSGNQGTFFGIHKDGIDELVLNYVIYGKKKWWMIKKEKEEVFKETVFGLIGSKYNSIEHILEHELIWIDGDWLNLEYPEIEVETFIQNENQLIFLLRSDLYHWGINVEPTFAEINTLRRTKEIDYDRKKCCELL